MFTLLRKSVLLSVAVLVCVLVTATVPGAASLSSLVPASNEISGWKALQADVVAASPNELWKIYDGGDGEWKQAGVTSAFLRYYKNETTGKTLSLTLHKTGTDWQKAKALYRNKNASIRSQAGYQTITVTSEGSLATPTQGVQAHSWTKYYYCTVTVRGTSAAEVTAAKQFLLKTAAKIAANG